MDPDVNTSSKESINMMSVTSFESGILSLIKNGTSFSAKKIIAEQVLWRVTDKKNNTLLHYATEYDNAEIVDYLLGSGSRVDARNTLGETPLMIAALKQYWGPTIEILMRADPNIYHGQESGKSALQLIGDRKFVSKLTIKLFRQKLENYCLNHKEEIAWRIFQSRWPLPKILQLEDRELLEIMLQRGYVNKIGIDAVENNDLGQTALHIAVMNLDVEYVKILVEHNANMVEDSYEKTPLSYLYDFDSDCTTKKKLDILKLLLQRIGGASIDPRQSRKIFEYGSEEAIKLILQSNIDLMSIARDYDGYTSVHFLAKNQNAGAIQLLRNLEFDVDEPNKWGETPLIVAATSRNVEAIEFLLNAGADIDARNANGRTALIEVLDRIICPELLRDCVQALLEGGTNVQMPITVQTIFHTIWCTNKLILGDLVLAHLTLLQAQRVPISQLTYVIAINFQVRFRDFFVLSRQQLNTVIYRRTTLFDLLTGTDHQLEIYGRDETFIPMMENVIATLSDSNYYYGKLLQKRIAKVRLRKISARLVCKITGTSYDSFPLIADDIASYLELSDMKNLMKACGISKV